MNLTAVIEFATLAAFAVVLLGGRDKREGGAYKMVSGLILLVAITQLVSMAIVVRVTTCRKPYLAADFDLGLPLRSRQPLLCWLEARP